jgi:hypothetical protein
MWKMCRVNCMKKILIVVVVKAMLSLVLIEDPDQLKPLSTVHQLTDYSTVRYILRS